MLPRIWRSPSAMMPRAVAGRLSRSHPVPTDLPRHQAPAKQLRLGDDRDVAGTFTRWSTISRRKKSRPDKAYADDQAGGNHHRQAGNAETGSDAALLLEKHDSVKAGRCGKAEQVLKSSSCEPWYPGGRTCTISLSLPCSWAMSFNAAEARLRCSGALLLSLELSDASSSSVAEELLGDVPPSHVRGSGGRAFEIAVNQTHLAVIGRHASVGIRDVRRGSKRPARRKSRLVQTDLSCPGSSTSH